jgi:hypothetical protein
VRGTGSWCHPIQIQQRSKGCRDVRELAIGYWQGLAGTRHTMSWHSVVEWLVARQLGKRAACYTEPGARRADAAAAHARREQPAVRNLRPIPRLPPLLRVLSIVGLLLPLASLVLLLLDFLSRLPSDSEFNRMLAIVLNLTMLAVACSFAVHTYRTRFRRPEGGPVPLAAWQSQLQALLLAAALPLWALALAVVITPATEPRYTTVFLISILAACVSYGANLWLFAQHQAAEQQERSPGLAALAALSLAGWLALYGLFWYLAVSPASYCGDGLCFDLLGPVYFAVGTGAFLGFAAWLWVTVRLVRRREGFTALSIGLLLPVALVNALLMNNFAVGVAHVGSWELFSVVSATLLATSVTRRPTVRRAVAGAGLGLAVALLVASNLVG